MGVAMEKAKAKSQKSAVIKPVRQPWHAVTLLSKGETCEAVRALRGVRFLSSEAPHLPLPQCTQARACTCSYRHHSDRRGIPRRADEAVGLKRNKKVNQERRQTRDRRNSD
jgi:hypothetical protein